MNTSDSSPVLSPRSSGSLQARQPELILASASPIRLALLHAVGLSVTARTAGVDETAVKRAALAGHADPGRTALRLAELKAEQVSARAGVADHGIAADAIVIGADQLLVCDGEWFDKPADIAAARTHLRALRGRPHELHTAVCLHQHGRSIWHHVARPCLVMREFSDAMLDAYLSLEGPMVLSSVGAYRLEGPGMQLFDQVQGEHAAILGLPLLALLGFLRRHRILLQ